VYANQRTGQFQARAVPQELGKILALAVADVNSDSVLDLVLLQADGKIQRLSQTPEGDAWRLVELARWANFPSEIAVASARLFLADLDNNGGLDLIASLQTGGRVWLSDVRGEFRPLDILLPGRLFAIAELTGDGKLDLLGLSETGQPLRLVNRGTKNYFWLTLRPRATPVTGDGRINAFALGGEIGCAGGVRPASQSGGGGPTTLERLVSLGFCLRRRRHAFHHGLPLALAAGIARQRSRDGRRTDDGGLGEDSRRSTPATRWGL
jgi:hypothetical protein